MRMHKGGVAMAKGKDSQKKYLSSKDLAKAVSRACLDAGMSQDDATKTAVEVMDCFRKKYGGMAFYIRKTENLGEKTLGDMFMDDLAEAVSKRCLAAGMSQDDAAQTAVEVMDCFRKKYGGMAFYIRKTDNKILGEKERRERRERRIARGLEAAKKKKRERKGLPERVISYMLWMDDFKHQANKGFLAAGMSQHDAAKATVELMDYVREVETFVTKKYGGKTIFIPKNEGKAGEKSEGNMFLDDVAKFIERRLTERPFSWWSQRHV
jgi:Mor family transcriptional regulator